MIEVCFCEKAHFYFTPPHHPKVNFYFLGGCGSVEKYWGE